MQKESNSEVKGNALLSEAAHAFKTLQPEGCRLSTYILLDESHNHVILQIALD